MPITLESADDILSGLKKFEFRTRTPKENVSKVYLFALQPVLKVVGVVDLKEILIESPDKIWELTKDQSKTSKKYFDSYFHNQKKAFAYYFENPIKFRSKKEISEFGLSKNIQSFSYIKIKIK